LNLIIDIGNTRVKAALFKENQLFELRIFDSVSELLSDLSFIKQAQNAIIGSVVEDLTLFNSALNSVIPTLTFTHQTKIPLLNLYHSASTLGSDRLAAAVGANMLYPSKDVLVIDAGTCIKYNFINSKNEYLGGAISPGLKMRFKSLEHFTSKLPLIELDENFDELIGRNTQNSILSGVLNGSIAEIDGLINDYVIQFPEIICILTGGDTEFLAKRLKNSIFTHQNLVLKGLNDILNYNLEDN
jgi:type III pantothenate kinase